MNTPSELSTISGFRKPVSPINGVGRILGFVMMRLLEGTTDDHTRVIKFVMALALNFNLRVKWKRSPSSGFYTFFVTTPKEGLFNPDVVPDFKDCYCTSFKISEGALVGARYLGPVFSKLESYSWNDLRGMTDGVLNEAPLSLEDFKRVVGKFSPESFSREGTELNSLRLCARHIRELLEDVTKKLDLNGLC